MKFQWDLQRLDPRVQRPLVGVCLALYEACSPGQCAVSCFTSLLQARLLQASWNELHRPGLHGLLGLRGLWASRALAAAR